MTLQPESNQITARDPFISLDTITIRIRDRGERFDFAGVIVFLLPLCVFLALMAYDFAATSWSMAETSREPGGLPYPMIPLLKSLVIVMPVAVALQGVSMLMRALATIRAK